MKRTINAPELPSEVVRLLLESWLIAFATRKLGITQFGSGGTDLPRVLRFGEEGKQYFQVTDAGDAVVLDTVDGLEETAVIELIEDALARVAVGDLGTTLAYSTVANIDAVDFTGGGRIHFMRLMGGHPHIEGPRRLSDLVVLDFREGVAAESGQPFILFPLATTVTITVFVTGPASSELTHRQAAGITEMAAAVCALATGRPLNYDPLFFPLEGDAALAALVRQHDPGIPGLARDSVSLDVFGELVTLGEVETYERVRGSLLAYEAALKQQNADVALMLLVTCIEALVAPRQSWGKEGVTSRFIKSLLGLCPETVDELVGHRNVEQAFNVELKGSPRKRRTDLLSRIYDARSLPTHTGLAPGATSFPGMADSGTMRVALVADLAQAAILAYLQAPRSSLIGHPMYAAAEVEPEG